MSPLDIIVFQFLNWIWTRWNKISLSSRCAAVKRSPDSRLGQSIKVLSLYMYIDIQSKADIRIGVWTVCDFVDSHRLQTEPIRRVQCFKSPLIETSSKQAMKFAFATAYGVFSLASLGALSVLSPPFPLPLPFPLAAPHFALALGATFGAAFAFGALVSLRLATRRRWLCGVTGFCFPKQRRRIGSGIDETGFGTGKENSASIESKPEI